MNASNNDYWVFRRSCSSPHGMSACFKNLGGLHAFVEFHRKASCAIKGHGHQDLHPQAQEPGKRPLGT